MDFVNGGDNERWVVCRDAGTIDMQRAENKQLNQSTNTHEHTRSHNSQGDRHTIFERGSILKGGTGGQTLCHKRKIVEIGTIHWYFNIVAKCIVQRRRKYCLRLPSPSSRGRIFRFRHHFLNFEKKIHQPLATRPSSATRSHVQMGGGGCGSGVALRIFSLIETI